jgi:DNA-nicking Smr family endonuclease
VVKIHSLQDLKQVRTQLAEQARLAAQAETRRREAQRRVQAEQDLFKRAAGAVQPLRHSPRVALAPDQPAPIPVQQQLDEQRALQESISDEFDASTLLDVDDAMSFRRPGIGTDVTRKLRRGDWSIQREIDLHGLRREDARDALSVFVRESHKHGLRCVRVVHGKGAGSGPERVLHHRSIQTGCLQHRAAQHLAQAPPAGRQRQQRPPAHRPAAPRARVQVNSNA